MNDDLFSRSALKEWLTRPTGFRANCEDCTDIDCLDCIIGEAIDNAPAVDAETVCKQIGLVKEAFEMAKADLVAVVRCRDCVHYEFGFCVRSILYSKGQNGYCENGERRSDK